MEDFPFSDQIMGFIHEALKIKCDRIHLVVDKDPDGHVRSFSYQDLYDTNLTHEEIVKNYKNSDVHVTENDESIAFEYTGNRVNIDVINKYVPSELNLNINEIFINIRKIMLIYSLDDNNSNTWSHIKDDIDEFLNKVKSNGYLSDYSIDVGATKYEGMMKETHINVVLNSTEIDKPIIFNFKLSPQYIR
jgi:hypothetical protein